MKKWVVLAIFASICLSVAAVRAADDPKCVQLVADSERLWMARDFDGSDKAIAEAMKLCPKMAELYWRKARNEYDRIEMIPRNKKPSKEQLIARYRGIEKLAAQCIALAPNDGNCWQWKGIGMGRRGTTQGILNSLGEAPELERTFLKAEKLAPQYRASDGSANALGDIYDGLGQFYRVVPEWLCTFGIRQIVGVCGDLKKSVSYLRKEGPGREPDLLRPETRRPQLGGGGQENPRRPGGPAQHQVLRPHRQGTRQDAPRRPVAGLRLLPRRPAGTEPEFIPLAEVSGRD